jgi:hypothetical protein
VNNVAFESEFCYEREADCLPQEGWYILSHSSGAVERVPGTIQRCFVEWHAFPVMICFALLLIRVIFSLIFLS